MASAAAILADASTVELEFVRPFHPVLRRDESEFARLYKKLDDLGVDMAPGCDVWMCSKHCKYNGFR